MKRLKGFTLVELIVVVAIFSLIMMAVLSILNPIANVYENTAKYEHMRAASDNVRLYLEDNLRYADKMEILYNANDSDAVVEGNKFIQNYKFSDGSKTEYYVGNEDANDHQALYIMKINNPYIDKDTGIPKVDDARKGEINIYKFTGNTVPASDWNVYKSANENLYSTYYYHFDASSFDITNSVVNIDVFKFGYDTSESPSKPVKLKPTDERYYKLSTAATFSFINLRNFQNAFVEETELKYYNVDGVECDKDTPGAIEVDMSNPTKNPYKGCYDKNNIAEGNIYFIYTLPKFVNQYN